MSSPLATVIGVGEKIYQGPFNLANKMGKEISSVCSLIVWSTKEVLRRKGCIAVEQKASLCSPITQ
jgi:hypothetical protein